MCSRFQVGRQVKSRDKMRIFVYNANGLLPIRKVQKKPLARCIYPGHSFFIWKGLGSSFGRGVCLAEGLPVERRGRLKGRSQG